MRLGARDPPRDQDSRWSPSKLAASHVQTLCPLRRTQSGSLGDIAFDPGRSRMVYALHPAPFEWIRHIHLKSADRLDDNPDDLAILNRAHSLVVHSECDDVAGLQRGNCRGPGDHRRNWFRQIAHRIVVTQRAIHPEPHVQSMRVRNLIRRGNPGPHGPESVIRLVLKRGSRSYASCGKVKETGVSKYVLHGLFR